jgi:hypothetical protein
MRIATLRSSLIVAAAIALLAGCADNAALNSSAFVPPAPARSTMARQPIAITPYGMLRISSHAVRHFTSFNNCPASGDIEYISDFGNSVINVYKGTFAGQSRCGRLAGSGISQPEGLFVYTATHDLYVANTGGFDILVFHRGATTPYATLTDPGGQFPVDVTRASDGTVIASNSYATNGLENGSISTWKSGTFVGNFPMVHDILGEFVTVQKNGTLYFNDIDLTGAGLLWTGNCPLGVCGKFTSTGAATVVPGGLRSADQEDVLQIDQAVGGALITYESFPNGTSCAIGAGDPDGLDLNWSQHHVFYADAVNNVGGEMQYPACTLIGTVPGNPAGLPIGIAVDPAAGL